MEASASAGHIWLASRMLYIPAVDFINVLRTHFLYKILVPKKYKAKM